MNETDSTGKYVSDLRAYVGTYVAGSGYYATRGKYFAFGPPINSGFNTVLPPNSPSCLSGNRDSWGVVSASSNHSGGVNLGLFDGSCRFVSETVNAVTSGLPAGTTPQQKLTGQSDFGVWGALGSPNGGESQSL